MLATDWHRLIKQIKNGDCTPFLGPDIGHGTLPAGPGLSTRWAEAYEYPFNDDTDLPRVLTFATTVTGNVGYIKNLIAQEISAAGHPDFSATSEPHAFFADFPFSVYLTTNHDDFMEQALQAAGKRPSSRIFPWYDTARYKVKPLDGAPGPVEPLVYHLHGSTHEPTSMVLTEDDHLEFLTAATGDHTGGDRLLPASVLEALTRRPLLFLGHSLHGWTFQILFHALLKDVPGINRRRHVSVQLQPVVSNDADRSRATEYLEEHLGKLGISIYWGSVEAFCAELRERMGRMP